jgi:Domain of unknown function (DU1801)
MRSSRACATRRKAPNKSLSTNATIALVWLHAEYAWTAMPSLVAKSAKKTRQNDSSAPSDPKVAAVFSSYPEPLRTKLLTLRQLILDTASATDGVGPLDETIKWGQVSYLTSETGSGSTVRIDRVKSAANQYAVYFHCQTNLVEMFRELYPELTYGGNRSILLDTSKALPKQALRHCVALALTYHLNKRKSARS